MSRFAAPSAWAFLTWLVLTWTRTAEQLIVGVGVALAAGVVCAPLGRLAPPWAVLRPRRLVAAARLVGFTAGQIVRANLSLARRIWLPSRPLRAGMVIVPTELRSDGGLAAVGIISSLIVDNQIVDLDRRRHELQYHAVSIEDLDPEVNRKRINGPLEARLRPFAG
ncbi:MAG TPA: Na+/H+ antiporter subunit E [Acidimicrobiia bacterium]|nr:Na+/H+ antiporter subunit E [Acidimicrobiia bacterium]